MIQGVHALIYAKDADKTRAFFRDVLGFKSVDAGHGWLIFALPPAELGIHPAEDEQYHELYLMCDDINKTMADLEEKGVKCALVNQTAFGLVTSFEIPGGGKIGMYQPRHPTAIGKG
ncbi:MAG TPA: VOC family protein [Terriglobales bacterium]|nr:VOC family protein [Terriglobales bacterium]